MAHKHSLSHKQRHTLHYENMPPQKYCAKKSDAFFWDLTEKFYACYLECWFIMRQINAHFDLVIWGPFSG